MTEWSVSLGFSRECASQLESEDRVGDVAEKLADFSPVISVGDRGATVRVAGECKDALAAANALLPRVLGAMNELGCRLDCVQRLEVTEWRLLEEELNEPTFPELVGISEIADLLGTTRQRASELARSTRFPAPLADLKAGPVWLKPTVLSFCQEWDRKPGRPRSNTAAYLEARAAAKRDGEEATA